MFCQGGAGKGILLILGPRAGKGTGILISFFGRSGAGKGILLILGPRTGKGTGILLLFQTAGNGNGKFLGNLQYEAGWPPQFGLARLTWAMNALMG